jgi:hypothetical protein
MSTEYDKVQQSAKKGTITYKNITRTSPSGLHGFEAIPNRTNAEQVSIVKMQTDQTRYGGYLNGKPRLHNQEVTYNTTKYVIIIIIILGILIAM